MADDLRARCEAVERELRKKAAEANDAAGLAEVVDRKVAEAAFQLVRLAFTQAADALAAALGDGGR